MTPMGAITPMGALARMITVLTFPRFPLRKKEHKSYFCKNRTHDFRTTRCAGYLLDHSGDECMKWILCWKHMRFTHMHTYDPTYQGKRFDIFRPPGGMLRIMMV